ncbi:hypothetical protein BHE74_00020088 [Ensete ventricosum]|nr:hypothetical protein GW17_00047762 [Ensete ventricosum]RWW72123.1 hypothetical protein BHE74_00020088 [Ensete ventricosum]RZS02251.1 hypothetical protein BHM03_00032263 [Ensete ventricosum]
MTTKHKSLTSGSSIHPRLSEVIGGQQSKAGSSITPFTISGKGSHYPTNTRVQKDMNKEIDMHWKHMRNNESFMHHTE